MGENNLQRIARENLVHRFDYDISNKIVFFETCVGGKHHHTPFGRSSTKSTEALELVHSDVCGRMQEKSLGAEYFVTFTDDHKIQVGVHSKI